METSNNTTEEYLRMDLTKSDLFLEILSFLEGVSQFLGNDFFDAASLSDEDKTKLGEQRRSLHSKSNYLWKLFNMSINDENMATNYPYLNMDRNKKHVKLEGECVEQTYDYCSFETNFEEVKKLECPYMTLGVTEVIKKGVTIEGELVQIERRSFFGKPKTMFVILIERWLLIYGSKTDKRPIQWIFIKRCERIAEANHTNAFRIFPITDEKPSEFQCSTQKQANEWIFAIESVLKSKRTSHGYVNVNKTVNIRKLPTPPAVTYRKSNKSDDIYEEPDLVTVRKSTISQVNVEGEAAKDGIEINEVSKEELTYDNVDHHSEPVIPDMPHIPVKLGSFKAIPVIVCPNYDVPKNNRLVLVEDLGQGSSSDVKKSDVKTEEKEESPSKNSPRKSKDIPSASHSRSNSKNDSCSSSVVQNTEEIKEKLRQQGITLTPIKAHPASSKSSNKFSLSPTKDINRQTIKNWFKTKLNKAPSDKEKRKSTSDSILNSTDTTRAQKSLSNDPSFPQKPSITTKTANNNNGSKVNMIIHQLEANGHLKHLLTKTKVQRRHTIVDDSYELVSSSQTSSSKEMF